MAGAMLFVATPAAAQEWPLKVGSYWDVSSITVKDGGDLKYATHLANVWTAQQEMAKAKGWIKGHHILENSYPRADEPTYYLVTVFDDMVKPEEAEKRGAEMRANMTTTIEKMVSESGGRTDYRTIGSQLLLREMMKR
jgi:hypothetical protein